MRPIGIDLFSGAGGLSLGFEQAGFDIAAAVEIDPIHCAVHKYNFPNTVVIPHSVENVTGAEIRKKAKLGKKRIGCVFGGAPKSTAEIECKEFLYACIQALEDRAKGIAGIKNITRKK